MSQAELTLARVVTQIHYPFVFKRRIRRIAGHMLRLLADSHNIEGVDVGCGSGELAALMHRLRPDVAINGVEVLVRPRCAITVFPFDGRTLPLADKTYDFVMMVDVVHHAADPLALLKECARVARQFILIKDHFCESAWDKRRLMLMDWVGNRGYNVALPYQYLSQNAWSDLYQKAGIKVLSRRTTLGLYPPPFSWLFDGRLHFIDKLGVA